MVREVTEKDFRQPEYRDAKVEDYEFRSDGALVRKDRWETAIQSIRSIVGIDCREFEITDVVDAVRKLAEQLERDDYWIDISGESEYDEMPGQQICEVKLVDGSIIREVRYFDNIHSWQWAIGNMVVKIDSDKIIAWREQQPK